jgi:leader peptidase (prepilin peptidase) / N-methyltransferase
MVDPAQGAPKYRYNPGVQLTPVWYALIFILGLIFGSFFNVAIYRWPQENPKDREWVRTPSHCPKCGARIRPYDNIPLLSYLILRGRCRDCRTPISWRYPAVELGTALLWLGTAWLVVQHGLTGLPPEQLSGWHIGFAIYFASLFFLTIVIDSQTQIIPDEICVALLAGAWLFMWLCHGATISPGWSASLIGMFSLSVFFLILALFGGMGSGDAKLAVGLGALFGWPLIVAVGFLAVLLGGAVAIVLLLVMKARGTYRRGIPIPFGPYLALAAYFCLFAGREISAWYLSLFR